MKSPVGELTLIASSEGLSGILWEGDSLDRVQVKLETRDPNNRILIQAEAEINEYFNGRRTTFSTPLDPKGTDFQLKVWNQLKKIPFGKTMSYGELARDIGNPKASRAVGGANGKNPISIIIPCHRVIGASGGLTGFAGGLDIKSHLLDFENSRDQNSL